jgi:squalene-hopene/tetraprenyl-beta-curcumene cyclase
LDGGWSGAPGAASSIEETALALEALASGSGIEAEKAIEKGAKWLAARILNGEELEAAPIGLYFARLWYYERLYPLIFATAALKAATAKSG